MERCQAGQTEVRRAEPLSDLTPCFTPGTMIATARGEVPVEHLAVGDRVVTRDNGLQEVLWTGRRDLSRVQLSLNPHLRPVLIRTGTLGSRLPEWDILVSPNHRMLVKRSQTALHFDEPEVLVAAKHLICPRIGIRQVMTTGISYLHFLCERHEVVLANGAWTESFQPADWSLGAIGNAQRSEILELFPDLRRHIGRAIPAARMTLDATAAARLIA